MSTTPKRQLAVNTSETRAQIILFDGSKVIVEKSWEKQGSHSEIITDTFSGMLKEANTSIESIDKIFCVTGPGSFTGIRVGVNFCKTLAYSLGCEIVALSALDLLAINGASSSRIILSVIDAQKNSVFFSKYKIQDNNLVPMYQNKVIPVDSLKEIIDQDFVVCGNGLNNYLPNIDTTLKDKMFFNTGFETSDLKNIFSETNWEALKIIKPWSEIQPLYIKASAPEEKIKPTLFES